MVIKLYININRVTFMTIRPLLSNNKDLVWILCARWQYNVQTGPLDQRWVGSQLLLSYPWYDFLSITGLLFSASFLCFFRMLLLQLLTLLFIFVFIFLFALRLLPVTSRRLKEPQSDSLIALTYDYTEFKALISAMKTRLTKDKQLFMCISF